MGIFRYPKGTHSARVDEQVETGVRRRCGEHGDVDAAERGLIGNLLEYHRRGVEDISYDLYLARRFAALFPDPAYGERVGRVADVFRRAIRRCLRRQIVFNQAVLGVLEDLSERLRRLEGDVSHKVEGNED